MANKDIKESIPYDLTTAVPNDTFTLTDIAYDVVIDNIPFLVKVDNQNPYRRETAQYKKDQFDSSVEPGEQSLSGWWLRSQTSFHNGAGLKFYEPGTDYQHVSHRFADSRGIDVWTIGEASMLPALVDVYTGNNLINATVGNDGVNDCLITGDSLGILKKVSLNGDLDATTSNYVKTATSYPDGHNGSNYPFQSVTSDGTHYYAVCPRGVHVGSVNTAASDVFFWKHSTIDVSNTFIKYVKGYVLLGVGRTLSNLDTTGTASTSSHTTGAAGNPTNYTNHLNSNWTWTDATAGASFIYVSGYAGNNSEIWAMTYDATANSLGVADSVMVATLPEGELVNALTYYLGYLAVGTNKGLRICQTDTQGNLNLGPLLYEGYAVEGFATRGNYLYAATKLDNETGTYTHAAAVRVDLSLQFDDGTFAYANDIEYESSNQPSFNISNKALTSNVATLTTTASHEFTVGNYVTVSGIDATFNGTFLLTAVTSNTFSYAKTASNVTSTSVYPFGSVVETPSNSRATEIYNLNDRIVLVVEENGTTSSGELHVEHTTLKRSSGWLRTGVIRYATIEPKFFRYLNANVTTGSSDSIQVYTIDQDGLELPFATLTSGTSNIDVFFNTLEEKQLEIAIKFVFTNSNDDVNLPVLKSYQIKAMPAVRRQRLIQYPMSCFDIQMDRNNSIFGYYGRSIEIINRLESLEETGKFVTVTDYRTNESFNGIIEEVRFTNESSPDKNNSGFGGLLTITLRKM